ncbi:MAG TPA: L-threonylcarbamoyladenylate synthase, partial [Actinomycetota bacterium]
GPDVRALEAVARFDERARHVAASIWPGPLTIVLPRAPGFDADLGGTSPGTVAVRVPAHPLALEFLAQTGPLGVTSANLSGAPPLTTAEEAEQLFGSKVGVLDGGACKGQPSTVLDLASTPRVLRAGAVDAAQLQALMS